MGKLDNTVNKGSKLTSPIRAGECHMPLDVISQPRRPNPNLIVNKHQRNLNWRIFSKIVGMYSSKISMSWKTEKLKNCFSLKETQVKCSLWSYAGSWAKENFHEGQTLGCLMKVKYAKGAWETLWGRVLQCNWTLDKLSWFRSYISGWLEPCLRTQGSRRKVCRGKNPRVGFRRPGSATEAEGPCFFSEAGVLRLRDSGCYITLNLSSRLSPSAVNFRQRW